ncbi:MAG: hypothetical protein Q4C47_02185 [Planctomycetia bacterium]|nr:hypothetical protein [Planctomycetia bacterium]
MKRGTVVDVRGGDSLRITLPDRERILRMYLFRYVLLFRCTHLPVYTGRYFCRSGGVPEVVSIAEDFFRVVGMELWSETGVK